MKRLPIQLLALAAMLVTTPLPTQAQDGGSIVGEVVDNVTLQPVVGATVTVVSHELSSATNEDGHFSLRDVPPGNISVRVEQLGYIAIVGEVEVHSNDVTFVQFPLSPMAFLLDELRVVADRPEDEPEDGGSYTEIVPDESDSARNALELLTTRVPSLTVRTDAIGGTTRSEIRIRGNASVSQSNMPSIYIDGARADIVYLEDLSATEVRRIRVLRGPSAASLYPDAANGVIIVETWRTRG
jgi:hypothetical protein